MNKLYAFLALVFLTACGSSLDGNWKAVSEEDKADGISLKITDNKARVFAEDTLLGTCNIDDSETFMTCGDDEREVLITLDGDSMKMQGPGFTGTFEKE